MFIEIGGSLSASRGLVKRFVLTKKTIRQERRIQGSRGRIHSFYSERDCKFETDAAGTYAQMVERLGGYKKR